MIWSFALDYKEYVCFKCNIGVPMFHSNEEVDVPDDYDEKYRLEEFYLKSKLNL